MKFTLLFIMLLSFFGGSHFSFGATNDICEPILQGRLQQKKRRTIRSLPKLHELQLPGDFLLALNSDPVVIRLKRELGTGKSLVFRFKDYDPFSTQPPLGGEEIQTRFVAKVLNHIFPDADFEGELPGTYLSDESERADGRRIVRLIVTDLAEDDVSFGEHGPVLDMPILKPSNPGNSALAQNSLRVPLGISPDTRIVSLYLPVGTQEEDLASAIYSTSRGFKPDIIIANKGAGGFGQKYNFHEMDYVLGMPIGYKITQIDEKKKLESLLSEQFEVRLLKLKSKIIPEENKTIIYLNQTSGQLPNLYNISDVAIVYGPINFFEPINAGARTVVIESSLNGYDPNVYNNLIKIAAKSGSIHIAKDNLELELSGAKILKSAPPTLPSYKFIVDESDATVLTQFLIQLETVIWKSIRSD